MLHSTRSLSVHLKVNRHENSQDESLLLLLTQKGLWILTSLEIRGGLTSFTVYSVTNGWKVSTAVCCSCDRNYSSRTVVVWTHQHGGKQTVMDGGLIGVTLNYMICECMQCNVWNCAALNSMADLHAGKETGMERVDRQSELHPQNIKF